MLGVLSIYDVNTSIHAIARVVFRSDVTIDEMHPFFPVAPQPVGGLTDEPP
jgi:hypothetical protein